jgi:hypothetical protein
MIEPAAPTFTGIIRPSSSSITTLCEYNTQLVPSNVMDRHCGDAEHWISHELSDDAVLPGGEIEKIAAPASRALRLQVVPAGGGATGVHVGIMVAVVVVVVVVVTVLADGVIVTVVADAVRVTVVADAVRVMVVADAVRVTVLAEGVRVTVMVLLQLAVGEELVAV